MMLPTKTPAGIRLYPTHVSSGPNVPLPERVQLQQGFSTLYESTIESDNLIPEEHRRMEIKLVVKPVSKKRPM
jgi:hypothetical protein